MFFRYGITLTMRKTAEIAKKHKCSERMVYFLKEGERKTFDSRLALSMAELTGKSAMSFIMPQLRKAYAIAFPELKG